MSWHCWVHAIDYPKNSQCPICREEEEAEQRRKMLELQEEASQDAEDAREREEERRQEQEEREEERRREQEEREEERHEENIRLREQEDFKRKNPGDYECPECLFITLKKGATRCPVCHAAIARDHWPPIVERERLQAEETARRERLAAEEKSRQERLAAEEWAKGEPERQRLAKVAAEENERKKVAERHRELLNIVIVIGFVVLFLGVYFNQPAPKTQIPNTQNATPPARETEILKLLFPNLIVHFGKPKVFHSITKKEIGFAAPELMYCRYDFDDCEVQILYTPQNAIAAYVIRQARREKKGAAFQSFADGLTSMNWRLGKSTLAQIADGSENVGSWMSDDAKFVSYIEKYCFGMPGKYCNYYFCSDVPDGLSIFDDPVKATINRAKIVPYAILVCGFSPKDRMTPKEQALWDHFLKRIVEVHGERYEEMTFF